MTKREYKYHQWRKDRKIMNGWMKPISLTLSEQVLWYSDLLQKFHE
jgi:hypothetical protein